MRGDARGGVSQRHRQARRGIVRQAMENSVQIRTENNMIMDNLKSIKEMIDVVLEKGIQ